MHPVGVIGGRFAAALVAAVALALSVGAAIAIAIAPAVNEVDTARDGGDPHDQPLNSMPSADGHLIAFDDAADNLVAHDTNHAFDIFVRNTTTETTTRVSVGPHRRQANGNSVNPSISDNGRIVAFDTDASNLIKRDGNGEDDVFVRNLSTGRTGLISVTTDGKPGNGGSRLAAISAGGRYISFASSSSNLIKHDRNRHRADIFLYDRRMHRIKLVSIAEGGHGGNASTSTRSDVSANGRYVTFSSRASNLVPGDTNGKADIFVRDLRAKKTFLVSHDFASGPADGASYSPSISAGGNVVAFSTDAGDLINPLSPSSDSNGFTDVYSYTRDLDLLQRLSVSSSSAQGDGVSGGPQLGPTPISSDGRYVAFGSAAGNLVASDGNGDSDIFIRDQSGHTTTRASVSATGAEANSYSDVPGLSADGRYVTFRSFATNLTPVGAPNLQRLFVRGPQH